MSYKGKQVSQADIERFKAFKAKKNEEKAAKQARLAAEFPLLFGKDAEARSTIGKYTNKTYSTTPGKKTMASTGQSMMKKPLTETSKLSSTQKMEPTSTKKTPSKGNKRNTNVKAKSTNQANLSSTSGSTSFQSTTRNSWLPLPSFTYSTSNTIAAPATATVTVLNNSEVTVPTYDNIELTQHYQATSSSFAGSNPLFAAISRRLSTSGASRLSTVATMEKKKAATTVVVEAANDDDDQTTNSSNATTVVEGMDPTANAAAGAVDNKEVGEEEDAAATAPTVLEEQVHDVLDYLLSETQELDPVQYRRLSSTCSRFSVMDIRRLSSLSMSTANGGNSGQVSVRNSHGGCGDSSSANGELNDENLRLSLNSMVAAPSMDDNTANNFMKTMNTVELATATAIAATATATNVDNKQEENEAAAAAGVEVNDEDILKALRVYISTIQVTEDGDANHPIATAEEVNITTTAAIAAEAENITRTATAATTTVTAAPPTATVTFAPSSVVVDSAKVPQPIPNTSIERIVTFPRHDIFLDAMSRGVVHAEVTHHLLHAKDNHVKYVIHVQMLDLPGNPPGYENIQMVLMKRFSEFKGFRNALLALPNFHAESLPPLPNRQVTSFGGGNSDANYLKARETYLRKWLEVVILRQSTESVEYRNVLLAFLCR